MATLKVKSDKYVNSRSIIQPDVYAFLKNYAHVLTPMERHVVLVFNEYKLSDIVPPSYNYADNDKPPPNLIVACIRFVKSDLYQPIGTIFLHNDAFTSGKSPTAQDLADCLRLYILAISHTSLNVVATVSPPSITFKKALSDLIKVTDMASYDGPLLYSVGKVANIVHLYDPSSMLKAFRNLFLHQDIEFKSNDYTYCASWKDLVEMYNKGQLPFLESEHISPSINMSNTAYAATIFTSKVSNTIITAVKNGMLPRTAMGTCILLKMFNNIYDSFTACSEDKNVKNREIISRSTYHLSFWSKALAFLDGVVFIERNVDSMSQQFGEFITPFGFPLKSKTEDKLTDNYDVEPMDVDCDINQANLESDEIGSNDKSNVDLGKSEANVQTYEINASDKPTQEKSDSEANEINLNDKLTEVEHNYCKTQSDENSSSKATEVDCDGGVLNLESNEMSCGDNQFESRIRVISDEFLYGHQQREPSGTGNQLAKANLNGEGDVSQSVQVVVDSTADKDKTQVTKQSSPEKTSSESNLQKIRVEGETISPETLVQDEKEDSSILATESCDSSDNSNHKNASSTKDIVTPENGEHDMKKIIADFANCDIKDCYGFFEDNYSCSDSELETVPLLQERKKNSKNEKLNYRSTEDTYKEYIKEHIGKTASAVSDMNEIENVGNNVKTVQRKLKKRANKSNRKKLKKLGSDCSDAAEKDACNIQVSVDKCTEENQLLDNRTESISFINDRENGDKIPLNNTVKTKKAFNECIKKLDVFTENNTHSGKNGENQSHKQKTDVKNNNIKNTSDKKSNITKTIMSKTNIIKKDDDVKKDSNIDNITQNSVNEKNNIWVGEKESDNISVKTDKNLINGDCNEMTYSSDGKPDLVALDGDIKKPSGHNLLSTNDEPCNKLNNNLQGNLWSKLDQSIQEMRDAPGFGSDSEPDMPSIPISDILEKLEVTDKKVDSVDYTRHEIVNNWMSSIRGMQKLVKIFQDKGRKKFSSKVFNVSCIDEYICDVRNANFGTVGNKQELFRKTTASMVDPLYAVKAMQEGSALLIS